MVASAFLTAVAFAALQDGSPPEAIRLPLPVEKPFFPEGRPLEGLVITLDPGHGGSSHTAGYSGSARGVGSRVVEQDLNMLVAAQLFHHLQAAGAKVYLTRRDDRRVTLNPEIGEATGRDQELGARVQVARDSRSHLFLSLHHNSTSRASAHGVVILIWPQDKKGADQPLERAFADVLREEVERVVPHAERFQHYLSEHPLVTVSDLPSAVVEFGFLSNSEFDEWVSKPGSHRVEAIGVYKAIERFWRERRSELEKERDRVFPIQGARPRPEREPTPAQKVARSLWTRRTKIADETNAGWFLEQYRRTTLSDRTLFHLAVRPKKQGGAWTVAGSANHPLLAAFAPKLLSEAVGRPVRGEVRVLPDDALRDSAYAIVRIPMAMTWGEPREGADVQSQALLGEPLFLLDRSGDGGFYLAHTADGYVGWIRRDALRLVSRNEFQQWSDRSFARAAQDVLLDDFRIPAGAWLPVVATSPDGGKVRIALPAGVRGTRGESYADVPITSLRCPTSLDPGLVAARAAAEFQGVPYVFGGRSRLGLDCSGLTGVAWAVAGVTLPRDARQQILVGRLVATAWHREGLRPGDLLFFIDETGRVVHAGISIGGSRYLHAMPPEVQVSSLDPADPMFSKTWSDAFAFARRPSE